jgi:hypothetical protein
MPPATKPMMVKVVRVRSIKPKYRVDGATVRPGDEHEFPLEEAWTLVRKGVAEIVDGTQRTTALGRAEPDPPGGGWWSATRW